MPHPQLVTQGIVTLFDADHYRARYPDIAGLSAGEAAFHYEHFGRDEGRTASPLAEREGLLALPRAAASALEIGPFCSPVLRGEGVRYLDMLDAGQLRARALAIGLDPSGCPERIHYQAGLAAVTDRFDAVVSCHAIEHQPDLIAHLQEVAAVLTPGGRYYLVVPDKRFCFDHFIAESTVAEMIAAYRERRTRHRLTSVIEHIALTTHNEAERHWRGDHGPRPDAALPARIAAALDRYDADSGYIDVHAWYFTPTGFRAAIDLMHDLRLSPLRAAAVYDTPRDRHEFCAILEIE